MTTASRSLRFILIMLALTWGQAAAQRAPAPETEQAASPTQAPGLIGPAEIRAWNSIRQNVLSRDGQWFVHVVGPSEGDATLVVRGTARDATERRIPVGNGGGSPQVSGDSRWLGFLVAPVTPPEGAAGRGGRGGQGGAAAGGGRGGQQGNGNTPRNKLVLMELATGDTREFESIRQFRFNSDAPTWIAMQGYPAGQAGAVGAAGPAAGGGGGGGRGGRGGGGGGGGGGGTVAGGGVDLLIYEIASRETFNVGLVQQYAFDEAGEWLAYTKDNPDQVGNSVQLRNMETSLARSIESDRVLYRQLAWHEDTDALSVMRGKVDAAANDTVFSIAVFADFDSNGPTRKLLFDPTGQTDFPEGWKLASDRAPTLAEDLSAVFFGVREKRDPDERVGGSPGVPSGAPGAGGTVNQGRATGANNGQNEDEMPSLVLWHAQDPRLQSQQIVQENQDRGFNYLAEYRFDTNRFVRLADDELRNVTVTPGDRYAYGTDNRAYQQAASYSGWSYQDVYRVDLETGARNLVMKKRPSGAMSASPDGRRLLFFGVDGHYWVLDLVTGDSVNITRNVPTSFVDAEEDVNNLFPPATPSRGWTKDGAAVLLYDNWDLWLVPTTPGRARAQNLTVNGKRDQLRYRAILPWGANEGPDGGAAGTDGLDMSKPLFVEVYGEWTKKEGLARVEPGTPGARTLLFEDANFTLQKAQEADVYVYTRQTFTEFPNYWVFNSGFQGGYQITDANPQMKDLAWSSGTRLIDYRSDKGDRLQGALYLPANYEPGRRYPLLVTIYEKRSQNRNNFVSPSETRAPDHTLFTNRGYAVLDPDIVYRVNDPGMSAVWSVIPAVKAAIATGVIDPERVGLWGHSWGGYQTAFLVTQTDIFAAAVAGAALTDMVSMYSSVYWNTGGTNQAIFESSQGRFRGNFLDNYDAYIRNSPAFHANKVTTPLMLLHNDKDGAVDFNQGITFFNTLRQLGKQVILLEYVGENHGLARPVNQRDYAVRMAEWFDHYLKDAPAPDWLKNGIPWLDMLEHFRSRQPAPPARPVATEQQGSPGGGTRRGSEGRVGGVVIEAPTPRLDHARSCVARAIDVAAGRCRSVRAATARDAGLRLCG